MAEETGENQPNNYYAYETSALRHHEPQGRDLIIR